MKSFRLLLLAAGAALITLVTLAAGTAQACPGQDGECACAKAASAAKACPCEPGKDAKCACGSECTPGHCAECKQPAGTDAKPACGSCGSDCGGAAAPAEGKLKATIDPATGAFVEEPSDDDAPAAAKAATEPAREIQQPGGGVMVAAPADRMPKAVATIDDSGKAHSGCAE